MIIQILDCYPDDTQELLDIDVPDDYFDFSPPIPMPDMATRLLELEAAIDAFLEEVGIGDE